MYSYRSAIEKIFAQAGIQINGNQPYDIQVKNQKFYKRFLKYGSLGLGESYMDGWWDCAQITEMFYRLIISRVYQSAELKNPEFILTVIRAKVFPEGHKSRSHRIGKKHYDMGNDLYQKMLDKRMAYSCGYWKDARNLDEAQEAKLELICRKLKLEPEMTVLDVGCGWGSFAKYAAEKYRVKVTGITVSREQLELAKQLCEGLPIELRYQDYRDVTEKFDCIASVGMFEHVGLEYHKTFMKKMNACLREDGLFLLHSIIVNRSKRPDPWLEKYIFPGCRPPSLKEIARATEGQFVLEDVHNFGADYAKTGLVWYENFERHWAELKNRYDERFRRMWRYYLLTCVAAFQSRYSNVFQMIFSKNGILGGYHYPGNYNLKKFSFAFLQTTIPLALQASSFLD